MSEPEIALVSGAGLWVAAGYLGILIVLGWLGHAAQKESSLSDFYLGGRRLGFVVLLLTLYATQYSGNTLIGFAAKGYREGFTFLVSVSFMMGIIGVYLIYAPRLQRLSRARNYITLSDYIQDRFDHRGLAVLVSVSGIVAMGNYILTNLKAIGLAAEAATGGMVTPTQGIVGLALIIVIYESLGGLRSVAWTDVVQGMILLVGCGVVFTAIVVYYDGFGEMAAAVREVRPGFWEPPDLGGCFTWLSTLLVVGLGIAIYPHSIQRIYAAKSAVTLRRAFQVMVFLPLFTTLLMVIVGIVGNARFEGLAKAESESITLLVLQDLAQNVPWAGWIITLFLCAVFAAIMSTIDSALLSISSMITQDLYRPLRPGATQAHLTRVGKLLSWGIMIVVVVLAIYLPQTIWRLIEVKLELLMQIAPALMLGLHLKALRTRPVFGGFMAGLVTMLFFTVGSLCVDTIPAKPFGLHSGLVGLGANLLVIGLMSLGRGRNES